jgi:hypothetical protein
VRVAVATGAGGGDPELPSDVDGSGHACQLSAILLWMHNGLGYIYVSARFIGLMPARELILRGREYEH